MAQAALNGSHRAPAKISLSSVVTGVRRPPMRLVVWGTSGIGKTTLAAAAPAPIFICAESGAEQVGAARFPEPETWEMFCQCLDALHEPHAYKTLVIDSLDALEVLLHEYLCRTNKWRSIDEPAYGRGTVAALTEWKVLLTSLDKLRKAKGMNVILIGHSVTKTFKNPEGEDFDRYELKLNQKAASAVKEWSDGCFFARHEVLTSTRDKRTRGVSTGARVIHTQWTAAFDAKNRYNLPEVLPLSWEELERAIDGGMTPAAVEKIKGQITEAGEALAGTEHADKASKGLVWAGDDPIRLAQALERLRALIGLEGIGQEEKADP